MKLIRVTAVASLFAVAIPLVLRSQQDEPVQQDDPPTRVARLNWLSGEVSLQPAGLDDWTSAAVNYPLSTGDHLYTASSSRAELHIGANAIRLDARSNFGFLNLSDTMVQVSLTEGSVEIHLAGLAEGDAFEVATPNGAISLAGVGDYRVEVDPGRETSRLTVRSGQADLYDSADPNSRVTVPAKSTADFQADRSPTVRDAVSNDDFDSFVSERERGERQGYGTGPVADLLAQGITGAEDLNRYGTWRTGGGTGSEWLPPVDANWDPYSEGDWTWIDPWGWTWIDAAPWGFAPFHYGRWKFRGGNWAWSPGSNPPGAARVYAPALVAFMGGGAADNVSWFPLGPGEPYMPPWHDNPPPRFAYSNRAVRGAVHTMSQRDFVASGHTHATAGLIADGVVLGSDPRVAPVRESVLHGTVRPAPPLANRVLIARTAPPAAPLPFAVKAPLLRERQGRGLSPMQVALLQQKQRASNAQRPAVRSVIPQPVRTTLPRSDNMPKQAKRTK